MTRVPTPSTADAGAKTRIVTAMFDTRQAAERAIDALAKAGIDRGATTLAHGSETELHDKNQRGQPSFWDELRELFLPDEDQEVYAEGLKRGGYLVSVRVQDAEQGTAVDILDDEGSVDLDERQESWRSSGWSGSQASSPDGDLSAFGAEASEASSEEVVPLAEERLRVGKRDVEHGRVRVRSYIIEEPVNEDVTLRRERVSLERRPVDKPTKSGADPFKERTVEVTEHAEEVVVSKDARIREELVLRKDADQRTETISDTVRRTEVEVELEDETGEKRKGDSSRVRKHD
jgi:uncharacterized protein (TIGR02271 family)